MRGYFGIGVEQISKAMNAGSLFRTAHAFGASFVFTVGAVYSKREIEQSDTSKSRGHVPLYEFPDAAALSLPVGCALVGVELLDESVDLPSFHHPPAAAYILHPSRFQLLSDQTNRTATTTTAEYRSRSQRVPVLFRQSPTATTAAATDNSAPITGSARDR